MVPLQLRHCLCLGDSHLIQQVLFYLSISLFPLKLTFSSYYHLDNVYIADSSNNRIRKVTVSTGIISTIAGTGAASYSGDNGPATSATLSNPYGVTLDIYGTHFLFCMKNYYLILFLIH